MYDDKLLKYEDPEVEGEYENMRTSFTKVPYVLTRSGILKGMTLLVWVMIRSYIFENNKDTAWPSLETLARNCGCHEKTVRDHINILINHGLVSKYRINRWQNNRYVLNPIPKRFYEEAIRFELSRQRNY